MTAFAQATIYGLLQGGLLALVAVGFSLVWGVMNVVNLSHGAFVILGAYIAWEINRAVGLDPFLAMLPTAIILFGLGYAIQRGLINLVINAPIFITLLLTFGLNLLLVNGMILRYKANIRNINTSYSDQSLRLPGDVRVPYGLLIGSVIAVAVTIGLVVAARRSRLGLSILATGMDRGAARLMGIRAAHIYAVTFGLAAAMAGIAGAAVGATTAFSPVDAGRFTLFSFVAAVVGGLGNMWGALYGGLLLGLVQGWGGHFLPNTLVNAVAFGALVVLLAVRPQGLAGKAFYASRVEV